MSRYRSHLIFVIVILTGILFAQYDEKSIYLKQAQSLEFQQQYERAAEIYNNLLTTYPTDSSIAEKYILLLLKLNKTDQAEEIYEKKQSIFLPVNALTIKTELYIKKGKVKESEELVFAYLKKNAGDINSYRTMANIYERNQIYETALKIYSSAQETANDPFLYAYELANDNFSIQNYKEALKYYFLYLEKNQGNFYYVNNQVKLILIKDEKLIRTIEKLMEGNTSLICKELYAHSLVYAGKPTLALNIFKELTPEKLLAFADEQYSAGNDTLAIRAYHEYLPRAVERNLIGDLKIKLAQVYLNRQEFSEAEKALNEVYKDNELQSSKYRFKTRANRQCRELLAVLGVMTGQPKDKIIKYYTEAQTFAYNESERKEIEFKLVNYLIMNEDYLNAENRLNNCLIKEEKGSAVMAQGYYYKYLLYLMKADSMADTMLNNMIIYSPEKEETGEALFFSLLFGPLTPPQKAGFMKAIRYKYLYKTDTAIDSLLNIYNTTGNEEVLLLAGEWSLNARKYEIAMSIYQKEYKDPVYKDYALLQTTNIVSDKINKMNMATDFLKANPLSVFSPEFRQIVMKYNKPN